MNTCIVGGFGSGVSTALRTRAAGYESPLFVSHPRELVDVAAEIVGRHDREVTVLGDDEVVRRVGALRSDAWPVPDDVVAGVVMAYERSFLGAEELRVHADAAGVYERWDGLAALTNRYVGENAPALVDRAGAIVRASLLLRDPGICAAERARWDAVVVDDYQQADFADARLLGQLAGPSSPVDAVVGGNVDAALWPADGRYVREFARRFSPVDVVALEGSWRRPRFPHLRLFDEPTAIGPFDGHVIDLGQPGSVEAVVGREWPEVLVMGCQEGVLPGPEPTEGAFFDLDLLHGPDVPDAAARRSRWSASERRRFAVACSRATEQLTVVAWPPVTPFITHLVE